MKDAQKLPISLVVITRDEEKNLARCLDSAFFFAEVVVLDSGSVDRTLPIAQAKGAKVFSESWRGFGPQKHQAVELASNDWVLCLDADEALSPELALEIQKNFSQFQPATAYQIPRKSFYLGRWILHGGWYPDYQLRLFHRKHWQWDDAEIHEKVRATSSPSKVESFIAPLQHYVFDGVADQVATNNRYSSLQAQQYRQKGGRFSFFKLLTKPVSKFIECYLWKAGFLDGLPGFIIAVGAAYSVFIRWAKIWQLSSGACPAEPK